MPADRIAVLGGGITGLAAAFRLSRAGNAVRLFEAAPRCGGAVRTERSDGWLIEAGPNAIQETPEVARWIGELGLATERVAAAPAAKKRYVVRNGRFVPVPLSLGGLIRTPLLSPAAKCRIFGELWRRPHSDPGDPSFADFIREHFGGEVLDRLAQPFVNGIYAGDPERLSARAAFPRLWEMAQTSGSILRGQIRAARVRRHAGLPAAPPLISFRDGLQRLPEALEQALPAGTVSLLHAVEALTRTPAGWTVSGRGPNGPWTETFDRIVCTLPAPVLARLPIQVENAPADTPFSFLDEIPHPPVTSLLVGFPREAIFHPLDGFGCLAPAVEKLPFLGIIFSSTLFPLRAPEGHVALTILTGGALRPETADSDPNRLWKTLEPHLQPLLGLRAPPTFLQATHWPAAIPQYNLGHLALQSRITATEAKQPGLQIIANFRTGISLPDCLISTALPALPPPK